MIKTHFPRCWEKIDGEGTTRLKVYGGWIVYSSVGDGGECMVFMPDPEHKWKLIPEPTDVLPLEEQKDDD